MLLENSTKVSQTNVQKQILLELFQFLIQMRKRCFESFLVIRVCSCFQVVENVFCARVRYSHVRDLFPIGPELSELFLVLPCFPCSLPEIQHLLTPSRAPYINCATVRSTIGKAEFFCDCPDWHQAPAAFGASMRRFRLVDQVAQPRFRDASAAFRKQPVKYKFRGISSQRTRRIQSLCEGNAVAIEISGAGITTTGRS